MIVKIYTTPICAYCKMAKEYFTSKNVKYEEIGLVGNPAAQQLVMSKTGMVVAPILEINGKFIVGFDRIKINEALGLK
ncbi:MAG: NrdH-redoxin [Candidatus Yanofskybacteria bacterium RIFCSPHIGHO2_02_FULL_38_22b]|uniref:NrdH-redoxin n=1 Tax=Candidatus Yanofskybacteria bacterium RIFCSPHIGHO2_02_FULL_38_22b TaxID=1802673 RepID=A0A1F8F117_9BACT|nr:MAG: NrdH-redoxin [Candidatus Yanofskybacteria bacterium RIFCSPHIGHO2_01_FULL_39_44]OGN06834.1 MAG: NrdH-redoxin [Candidatus Yanofskybacteria bacterium RIFCSPHIGHO2_02_FULL_38_22b]OGN20729.1 MAG: NrdH-redoxin [Candidatus Yanofskybacteria bacterium RIFCSPLOWO2_01_FULL_39_28]